MKLTELMDKHQQVQMTIFQRIIKSEGAVRIKDLEQELDVSVPTLQKEIRSLETALELFDEESKLVRLDNEYLSVQLANEFSVKKFVYSYLEQALDYQILLFVFQHKKVSITKMALDLQVSEASLFRRLKSINQQLEEFEIQFRNKKMVGDELQIRVFYYYFFWSSVPFEQLQKKFRNPTIQNLIQVIEKHFHLTFTKEQYWKLLVWLGIMHSRFDYRGEQRHRLDKETIHAIEQDVFYQELKNILARYLSRFAFQGSDEESIYLYFFILSEDLLPSDKKWLTQSPFIAKFLALNKKIYQEIVEDSDVSSFDVFLLELHVKVAFSKGWIDTEENDLLLLSDYDATKMSACMSIIEDELSKNISNSQWRMLDQAYGLVVDVYQRRQQKELLVGIAVDDSLQSEEIYQFIQQHLASVPSIRVKKAKQRVYSLLIASEYTDISQYTYEELYLFSGRVSLFEVNRLKQAIQELL